MPYVETEEFANVGIVATASELGIFDFRLDVRKIARLTAFFNGLDKSVIRGVLRATHAELTRIRSLSGYRVDGQTMLELRSDETASYLFDALVKGREGIIRYSDPRLSMSRDPQAHIDQLYDRYVRHDFDDPVYREGQLERAVKNTLASNDLVGRFHRQEISDGVYSARFPFVQLKDDRPIKIIKPIFLGQSDPSRILEHGNKWLFTTRRLRQKLPKRVIFAVEGPTADGRQKEAFDEAVQDFRNSDIEVVDALDELKVINSALH